jgi:hypothetical protein
MNEEDLKIVANGQLVESGVRLYVEEEGRNIEEFSEQTDGGERQKVQAMRKILQRKVNREGMRPKGEKKGKQILTWKEYHVFEVLIKQEK